VKGRRRRRHRRCRSRPVERVPIVRASGPPCGIS
jgi:hypothetical protein